MKRLSIGKVRGLQQIAHPDGIFGVCAMDHGGSLCSMIDEEHPGEVNYEEMVERKLELCSALAKYARAVLQAAGASCRRASLHVRKVV